MRKLYKSFGIAKALKERQIQNEEDSLDQAKRMNDVKEKAIEEESRKRKLATSEINYLTSEEADTKKTIEDMIEPVSIIVNTDMVSASEEYYDVRKDTDRLREEVAKSSQETITYSYLSMLKLGLSFLIVFITTRIMAGNVEFDKKVKAIEITKYIFVSIGDKSALMIDLFLQDTLMIAVIGGAIGVAYNKFSKFKSTEALLYATVGLIYSLCLMQLASIFYSL